MGSLLFRHWIQSWSWTWLETCKFPLNGKCLHWKADSTSPNSSIIFRSTAVSRVSATLRCRSLSQLCTARASYPATIGKCLSPAHLDVLQREMKRKISPRKLTLFPSSANQLHVLWYNCVSVKISLVLLVLFCRNWIR